MKITLCDKNLVGDIPEYIFDDLELCKDFIGEWLNKKQHRDDTACFNSVFVIFLDFSDIIRDYKDYQCTFLVSHSWDDITDFYDRTLTVRNFNDLNFNIFEFENYQEAFRYCIDLKESF